MGQFDDRERARVGDQAEVSVRQVISNHGEGALLRGPLLPITNSNNQIERYRESDFLVYTQGTVFCIEVKNYSGIISYVPQYQNQQIWNGSFSTTMNVFSGYDDSRIVQTKPPRAGQQPVQQTYPNPLHKTKSFALQLKKYVGRREPRFQHLFLVPVVCFGAKADISAIYDFENGMISIEQLPAFLDHKRNPRFASQPSGWIIDTILNKVPNWDRIQTTTGEWINGILVDARLTFVGPDGGTYTIADYSQIKTISWQKVYNASHLQMTVTYTSGAVQVLACRQGQISLKRGPQPESFNVYTVQYLSVGLANKMIYQ
jgi:Nuclease-related domain